MATYMNYIYIVFMSTLLSINMNGRKAIKIRNRYTRRTTLCPLFFLYISKQVGEQADYATPWGMK